MSFKLNKTVENDFGYGSLRNLGKELI